MLTFEPALHTVVSLVRNEQFVMWQAQKVTANCEPECSESLNLLRAKSLILGITAVLLEVDHVPYSVIPVHSVVPNDSRYPPQPTQRGCSFHQHVGVDARHLV